MPSGCSRGPSPRCPIRGTACGKSIVYIDLDASEHQVVAHFARAPSCPADIAFVGDVFEVRGPSKAAARGEPGAERDEFWEHAVDVVSWRCR
jgi:hypothetical protein